MLQQGLEKLYSREDISRQVQRLGAEINRDYAGQELLLVCVLKGPFLFFADLVRAISLPVLVDFVRAADYDPQMQTTRVGRIAQRWRCPSAIVEGTHRRRYPR
ncbi:MAG: phosphoribosyltransferase family protein [Syntrophotaleaceae bacterium]